LHHGAFAQWERGAILNGSDCLPGGIPIKLEARLPRSMGAGAWRYAEMAGYTSVGAGTSLLPVRLNCPPEITLHTLRHAT
jgi:predicted MPP superfamily phosphohydrolase